MEQIMNQTDVKVSFYLKKSEADAKGNCPVMARLIVGKYSETAFSVKTSCATVFVVIWTCLWEKRCGPRHK